MPFPLSSSPNKREVKLCVLLLVRESTKIEFWIRPWSVIELLLLLTVRWLLNSFDLLEKCQKGTAEEDTRLPSAKNTRRTGRTVFYLLLEYETNINANDILPGRENSLCISCAHFSVTLSLKKPERQPCHTFSVSTRGMRCRDKLRSYHRSANRKEMMTKIKQHLGSGCFK